MFKIEALKDTQIVVDKLKESLKKEYETESKSRVGGNSNSMFFESSNHMGSAVINYLRIAINERLPELLIRAREIADEDLEKAKKAAVDEAMEIIRDNHI